MTTLAYLPWLRPPTFDELPSVRDRRCELTYAEFAVWVDAVAEQLAEYGVVPGSTVAIMLPNRVELLVAMVAAWRLGAAATPINPMFTATEADYQIADAHAVIVVNAGPDAPHGGRPSISVQDLRWAPLTNRTLPEPDTSANDIALLIYTSGSTGRPKGVVLSHGNIGAMASMMSTHLEITRDDHCLLVLPLFHVNAICVGFLTPVAVGGQLTVMERFRAGEFLDAVESLRPTYFSAVPTIYAHLVSQPADVVADTSSIRFAICGAAPASKELLAATERRFGFGLVEGYGLTEATCACTCNPVDGPRKLGTVGVPLPRQRVAVMNEDGTLLPPGERGEVVVQGPNVMQGYLNRAEATADALGDGWLHTGDVGVLNEDGYLTLVDRIKDMIIRGGENIYPKEIETVLHSHPHVREAAVVGAADAVLGEVPVAYVSTYPDSALDADDLRALCRTHLTKIKVPVAIEILDALPKNPIGKVDKRALRTLTPAGRSIPAPTSTTRQGA
ncbi:class I adenylate-forming enzyme family protein [Rhodococcus tukisamuensis]|uniref:O-succinylbenzoate-CoA ligase n=1 Tax=Rhodococcus tukisamuensis TaxID=168276 RepID=A0A1G6QDR3_9NOCA|nr:AMP-binding protein [Rhodococcus tukisamuensis]SDC90620.1 O-succinylbenzoate-CoA ligase [Rhodococcus tukisamuensis]